ncbi:hypothetical protein AGR6A_Lc50023 [Agrobacterium sp. NCPPB 925]|nr:hypothetical protein AGR6A_Lc50023 [Agrobacterium sp. NCPPB 925]
MRPTSFITSATVTASKPFSRNNRLAESRIRRRFSAICSRLTFISNNSATAVHVVMMAIMFSINHDYRHIYRLRRAKEQCRALFMLGLVARDASAVCDVWVWRRTGRPGMRAGSRSTPRPTQSVV